MSRATPQIPFLDRHDIEKRVSKLLQTVLPQNSPWDAFEIAIRLGVPVRRNNFEDSTVSGALIRKSDTAEILIRESDSYYRQNFTVAHELGHFNLHPTGTWTDTLTTMYRRDYWLVGDSMTRRAEYQANLFAAALLMPEPVIRERWNLLKSRSYLAPFFRVSKLAVSRRLEELGLIVPSIPGFSYLDFSELVGAETVPESHPLSDDAGEIPVFQPVAVDEHGRIIAMSQEEREARQVALGRVLEVASQPDRVDPPERLD